MVDVRDEFKEYQGFSREEMEGFIDMLCIDWLFLTFFFYQWQILLCIFKGANKDIIIIILYTHIHTKIKYQHPWSLNWNSKNTAVKSIVHHYNYYIA